jgi:hypothetical protein
LNWESIVKSHCIVITKRNEDILEWILEKHGTKISAQSIKDIAKFAFGGCKNWNLLRIMHDLLVQCNQVNYEECIRWAIEARNKSLFLEWIPNVNPKNTKQFYNNVLTSTGVLVKEEQDHFFIDYAVKHGADAFDTALENALSLGHCSNFDIAKKIIQLGAKNASDILINLCKEDEGDVLPVIQFLLKESGVNFCISDLNKALIVCCTGNLSGGDNDEQVQVMKELVSCGAYDFDGALQAMGDMELYLSDLNPLVQELVSLGADNLDKVINSTKHEDLKQVLQEEQKKKIENQWIPEKSTYRTCFY